MQTPRSSFPLGLGLVAARTPNFTMHIMTLVYAIGDGYRVIRGAVCGIIKPNGFEQSISALGARFAMPSISIAPAQYVDNSYLSSDLILD